MDLEKTPPPGKTPSATTSRCTNVSSASRTSRAQSGLSTKLNTRKEDLKNFLGKNWPKFLQEMKLKKKKEKFLNLDFSPVLRPRADFDSSPIHFSNPMMPHTATSESNNYLSAAARLFQNPALLG